MNQVRRQLLSTQLKAVHHVVVRYVCKILTFPFSRKLQGIFELVYSMLGCLASLCKVFTQSYNAFKEMHAMISHSKLTTLGGARAV